MFDSMRRLDRFMSLLARCFSNVFREEDACSTDAAVTGSIALLAIRNFAGKYM